MSAIRRLAAVGCALALVVLAGCDGQAEDSYTGPKSDSSSTSSPSPSPTETDGTTPTTVPIGDVSFDFRDTGKLDRNARLDRNERAAIDAYVGWQRAATASIRARTLSDAVSEGADDAVVRTVEQSIDSAAGNDYTVPREMIGRLDSIKATPDAAILDACLWSPTFDYHVRGTGQRISDRSAHWMGTEVRMTRSSGHHGQWTVAGLGARDDCEGKRPQ